MPYTGKTDLSVLHINFGWTCNLYAIGKVVADMALLHMLHVQ